MTPLFSIIIPLYNKEMFIEYTIKSVLNQTFTDFELIVINDGSTDNGLNVVNSIKDKRIRIINKENTGLSAARNSGIKLAHANFIAFLDADDLWKHDYLECINTSINKHPKERVFATSNCTWFKKESPDFNSKSNCECDSQLIDNYFSLGKNIFSYSSIVFHKSVFDTIGYFNDAVNHGEEEEFTIKCLLHYNLVYINQQKVFYLKNIENQLTAPNKNRKRVLPDYETYLKGNTNTSLKKYIDFIYFKLVVLFKMEKNYKQVNFYKSKINASNLTFIQQIKFHLPTHLFYITKSVYVWFSKRFIHS